MHLRIVYTSLVPQQQGCKCMLIFQHGGYCAGEGCSVLQTPAQHPGPSVAMKPRTVTWFTQKFGNFFSNADFPHPFLCWFNELSPSLLGSRTNNTLVVSVTLQTLHSHTALLWTAEGWSTLFCQEEVPKLSHTTSWAGISRALCSCQAHRPAASHSWLHLMHTWRGQGRAPAVQHMNHLATLPNLLPNHTSFLEPLRLCILLCQPKLTGFLWSPTNQPINSLL